MGWGPAFISHIKLVHTRERLPLTPSLVSYSREPPNPAPGGFQSAQSWGHPREGHSLALTRPRFLNRRPAALAPSGHERLAGGYSRGRWLLPAGNCPVSKASPHLATLVPPHPLLQPRGRAGFINSISRRGK